MGRRSTRSHRSPTRRAMRVCVFVGGTTSVLFGPFLLAGGGVATDAAARQSDQARPALGRFAMDERRGLVRDDGVLGDGGVIAAILIASAVSDSLDDVRA